MAEEEEHEWVETELARSRAGEVIDKIRRHTCDQNDGWIHPVRVELDGRVVDAIGYGRAALNEDGIPDPEQEEIQMEIIAVAVDVEMRSALKALS